MPPLSAERPGLVFASRVLPASRGRAGFLGAFMVLCADIVVLRCLLVGPSGVGRLLLAALSAFDAGRSTGGLVALGSSAQRGGKFGCRGGHVPGSLRIAVQAEDMVGGDERQ